MRWVAGTVGGQGAYEKSLTGKQRDEPDQIIGHSRLKTD